METLEYSGFVDTLGVQWFLPSIQTAVDFIAEQRSLNPQAGKHRDVNIGILYDNEFLLLVTKF